MLPRLVDLRILHKANRDDGLNIYCLVYRLVIKKKKPYDV